MDTNFFMLNFAEIHEACSHLFLVLFLQMVLWNTCAAAPHFLPSCCHALHPPHFKIPEVALWETGWQEHESSSVLALLVAPRHSKPCSVGKVAFEVTFSLWRLLKGHLREASCLFLREVFSSGGKHPWRCRQQRLPVHPPRHKAAAAVVVTEKTLQTYWGNVTCAKEKQNQRESIILFQE